MRLLFIILIAAGSLAQNNTLENVHNRRNSLYNANLPESGFVCRLGVQHRHKDLLGQKLYFYDIQSHNLYGPMLVVDMAAPHHKNIMENRGIAADIDCPDLVHKSGFLFLINTPYNHPHSLKFNQPKIEEIKKRLQKPHNLCGFKVACHWRILNWIWKDFP